MPQDILINLFIWCRGDEQLFVPSKIIYPGSPWLRLVRFFLVGKGFLGGGFLPAFPLSLTLIGCHFERATIKLL